MNSGNEIFCDKDPFKNLLNATKCLSNKFNGDL